MGLRSLYFVLSGVIDKFHYLKPGLGLILAFVGVKMLLGHTDYKIGNEFSLAFTIIVLIASIVGSMVFPKATSGSESKSGPET
jgi:tellurite resistance protein TerC